MGEKLGLRGEGETGFMKLHSERVRALPGRGHFRTGISLQIPFNGTRELSASGSSEDRFILFASFPYFGKSSKFITLDAQSQSVRLLDFKRLGIDGPEDTAVVDVVGGGGIASVSARYNSS